MDHPRASLLGIPVELRLQILEYLFQDYVKGQFRKFFSIFIISRPIGSWPTFPDNLAIKYTCRQIHEGTTKVLLSKARLCISTNDVKKSYDRRYSLPMGRPEGRMLWRFLTKSKLELTLESEGENRAVVLGRTSCFTEQALSRGERLKNPNLPFSTGEDGEGLPPWYPEVEAMLKALRIHGSVHVYVDDVDDDGVKMCLDLKEMVRGMAPVQC